MSLFSIFKTSKYSFDDKRPYENVVLVLRRHWFVLFIQLLGLIVFGLLPFVIYAFGRLYLIKFGFLGEYWFLVMIYFLIWWLRLFYGLTMYFLDVWIVTDHRVIDSEQIGFFNRQVSELNIAKVQDISVSLRGFFPTFLNYGDLEIQTAGAENKFLFKEIPDPNKVKDTIMTIYGDFAKTHVDNVEIHEKLSGL